MRFGTATCACGARFSVPRRTSVRRVFLSEPRPSGSGTFKLVSCLKRDRLEHVDLPFVKRRDRMERVISPNPDPHVGPVVPPASRSPFDLVSPCRPLEARQYGALVRRDRKGSALSFGTATVLASGSGANAQQRTRERHSQPRIRVEARQHGALDKTISTTRL
jgi:hypothetical protein